MKLKSIFLMVLGVVLGAVNLSAQADHQQTLKSYKLHKISASNTPSVTLNISALVLRDGCNKYGMNVALQDIESKYPNSTRSEKIGESLIYSTKMACPHAKPFQDRLTTTVTFEANEHGDVDVSLLLPSDLLVSVQR